MEMKGQLEVVVQLSGGADSAVAAIQARERWPDAHFTSVFVDYGQVYSQAESIASAKLHALIFENDSFHTVSIQGLFTENVEVPLRNLFLTAVSASYAGLIGAEYVVVGSKNSDRFPDSKTQFYGALNNAMNLGGGHVEIFQPLSQLSKMDVYAALLHNEIGMNQTISCYEPLVVNVSEVVSGEPPSSWSVTECTQCWHCRLKARIAADLKVINASQIWWCEQYAERL